jgi:hypothetical protein
MTGFPYSFLTASFSSHQTTTFPEIFHFRAGCAEISAHKDGRIARPARLASRSRKSRAASSSIADNAPFSRCGVLSCGGDLMTNLRLFGHPPVSLRLNEAAAPQRLNIASLVADL